MLYLREKPQGIDTKIDIIQKSVFKNIGWENIEVYGRVYRNPTNNGITPEVYISGLEYKDVFTNDLKSGSVFFIDSETHKFLGGNDFEAEVKIVFMLDLKKLSGIELRNDSEVQNKAVTEIRKHKFFAIEKIEKGISTVFKGFDTSTIKINDMQPYHVFAVVGKLKYNINNC